MLHPIPQLGDVTVGVFSQPEVLEKLEQKMEDDAILCLQAPCGMRLYIVEYSWSPYSDFSTLGSSNETMDIFVEEIIILLGGCVKSFFYVHPKKWGEMMHFDLRIFPCIYPSFKKLPGEISRYWIPGSPKPKNVIPVRCFSWKCWVRGFPTQGQSLHKSPHFFQEVSQNWCGRLYAFFQQRCGNLETYGIRGMGEMGRNLRPTVDREVLKD